MTVQLSTLRISYLKAGENCLFSRSKKFIFVAAHFLAWFLPRHAARRVYVYVVLLFQRTAIGASGNFQRGHVKNVKNRKKKCQKCLRHFSTFVAQGKKRQKKCQKCLRHSSTFVVQGKKRQKKCQKWLRHFSTFSVQGKRRQKSSKSVKHVCSTFRQFSRSSNFPASAGELWLFHLRQRVQVTLDPANVMATWTKESLSNFPWCGRQGTWMSET